MRARRCHFTQVVPYLLAMAFLAGLTPIREAHSCEARLMKFPEECEIQDRFHEIRSRLKDHWNINIDDIFIYKTSRFIDQKSLDKAVSQHTPAEKIYKPAPSTWQYWTKGAKKTEEIQSSILQEESGGGTQSRVRCQLSLDKLSELHSTTITNELIGPFTHFVSNFFSLGRTPLLGPGKIRHSSLNFRPSFGISCEDKVDYQLLMTVAQEQLKDKNNKPILDISAKLCADGVHASGTIYYSQSTEVPERIQELIESFNRNMTNLLNSPEGAEHLGNELSPYDFAADIQRWYVAIHPFREGNGRLSRFLQDMIAKTMDLPYVPASLLQNDVLTLQKNYRVETKKAVIQIVDKLDKCLQEYEAQSGNQEKISFECLPINSPSGE